MLDVVAAVVAAIVCNVIVASGVASIVIVATADRCGIFWNVVRCLLLCKGWGCLVCIQVIDGEYPAVVWKVR